MTATSRLCRDGVAVLAVRFLAEHILEPVLQARRPTPQGER
jgi:hypothetical protein